MCDPDPIDSFNHISEANGTLVCIILAGSGLETTGVEQEIDADRSESAHRRS